MHQFLPRSESCRNPSQNRSSFIYIFLQTSLLYSNIRYVRLQVTYYWLFLTANVTERAVREHNFHAAFNLGQEETVLRSEDWERDDAEGNQDGDDTGTFVTLNCE